MKPTAKQLEVLKMMNEGWSVMPDDTDDRNERNYALLDRLENTGYIIEAVRAGFSFVYVLTEKGRQAVEKNK